MILCSDPTVVSLESTMSIVDPVYISVTKSALLIIEVMMVH